MSLKTLKVLKHQILFFPNNWISFHNTGEIFLFPMYAKNRRLERRYDIIDENIFGF